MTREIVLNSGSVILVDDDMYDSLVRFNWCINRDGYAIRSRYHGEGLMHRVVMHADGDLEIDHKDGNKLNNQRSNLRYATRSQNMANNKPRNNGTSKYKGVCWCRRSCKWLASVRVNYKNKHLGYFVSEEEAAHAYDVAACYYFGEFARTNFDRGLYEETVENAEKQAT